MFINMNPETATGFGFFMLNSNAMGNMKNFFIYFISKYDIIVSFFKSLGPM